jgi:hypothetical protein
MNKEKRKANMRLLAEFLNTSIDLLISLGHNERTFIWRGLSFYLGVTNAEGWTCIGSVADSAGDFVPIYTCEGDILTALRAYNPKGE